MKRILILLVSVTVSQPSFAFQQTTPIQSTDDSSTKQSSKPLSATEETARLSDLIENAVDWYELRSGPESSLVLKSRPVMRWRNVTRGQDGEAMMVIWTDGHRPEAVASIFPWQENLVHEMDSLSRGRTLRAMDDDAIAWAPQEAGIQFRPIPEAMSPGATPVLRQREMKALAARFSGVMTGWRSDDSDREELRLLPRQLYRYEIPADQKRSDHVIDGSLLAFVSGTDPEIILVLEAFDDGTIRHWEYACVRATSGGLEMSLDKTIIWTAVKYPDSTQITKPHMNLQKPIP